AGSGSGAGGFAFRAGLAPRELCARFRGFGASAATAGSGDAVGSASVPNELRLRRLVAFGVGASSAAGAGGFAGAAFLDERLLGAGASVASSGRYLTLFGMPGISV